MGKIRNLRWYIAGLLFLATVINYVDRQTLSVVAPALTKELNISNTEYSNILAAFLVPYTVMYIFSGLLVDRWGSRKSLAAFMAWWSAANTLHAAARTPFSFSAFRFLLGMGESGNFMAAEKVISEWFPPKERGFANGLVNAAAAVGAILSPPLITWIALAFGWREAFVFTGCLGFVWLIGWLWLYQTPDRHRSITEEERSYIVEQQRAAAGPEPAKIPYFSLLRFPQTWGLLLARVFADPVWWFYLFWLPKYLTDVRHFSMVQIGLIAWLPYLTADLGSLAGGWMSGRLIGRGFGVLAARKRTMLPCAALMPLGILIPYVGSVPALGLISVVTFCHMAWKTNLMTMTNDVYPTRIVGSVAGIVGLGAGLGGALFTPLVGRIVDAMSYSPVFLITGILHPIAMAIVYLLVRGRARHQPETSHAATGEHVRA